MNNPSLTAPPTTERSMTARRLREIVDQLGAEYKTVGEMVYSILRQAITRGAFGPGERLRQASLAEAIGVSRIPVRTALLQLETEGLVELRAYRGARVRTLLSPQIEEIYRLRIMLELHALDLSMGRMSGQRLSRLHIIADELDSGPEGAQFLDTRVRFYREVYDANNNSVLVELIESLRNRVGRYLLSIRVDTDHRHMHGTFVDFIEMGDLGAAQSWLRAHLDEVRKVIVQVAQIEEKLL